MMKNFKFLQEHDDDVLENEGVSWIYGRIENLTQYNYELVTDLHYGIHSFLNQFPNHFIVTVISITGPNGVEHNIDNDGIGWGFDILNDLITIKWALFID